MADEILTPEECAGLLKMSVLTVRSYLRSGQLKGIKMGRVWRIRRSDLEAFLEAHRFKE